MNAERQNQPENPGMRDETPDDKQQWIRSLVERHGSPLTRYARTFTGDAESARDAVQETFLRLCRQDADKIAGHSKPWLYKVCRSRALDYLRKEGRMTPVDNTLLELNEASEPSPSAELEKNEKVDTVLQVIESLPPNQKEVVRLKFQNELSYKEIAEVTGLSVTNVGFLLHVALKFIRKQIQGQGELMPESRGET